MAVVRGTEVLWTAAFGLANVAAEAPVTTDTPFQLASVSKTVIGAAVMRASELGQLSLDSPINLSLAIRGRQSEGGG